MEQLNQANSGQPDSNVPSIASVDMFNMPESLYAEVSQRFGLDRAMIETILPCTPFQRDVLDCAANGERHAVGHAIYQVPEEVEARRLTAAWKETVARTPALRACTFTSTDGDSFQLVLRETFVFSRMYWTSPSLTAAIIKDEAAAAMAGPRCNRLVLLDDPGTKKQLLVWTFSHAFVDSPFRARILCRVLAAYKGEDGQLYSLPVTPDSPSGTESPGGVNEQHLCMPKIPQTLDMERAKQFWKDGLSGLDASVFPHLSCHLATPDASAQAEHRIAYPSSTQHKWSSTTVCRTALAILQSRYTNSSEALFGVVIETSHVFGEQRLLLDGPTRTVVPFRVRCAPDQPILDVMEAVAACDHDTREFGHVGLRSISRLGEDQSAACAFQTVLVVADAHTEQAAAELHQSLAEPDSFAPCPNRALLLRYEANRDGALLTAKYDASVMEPLQMARFLRQLGGLVTQLQSATSESPCVRQLDILTQQDRDEIDIWNSAPLQTQNVLIHSEMLKWAAHSPSDPAVVSWDGAWSYAELDDVSSRLAAYIQSLDLGNAQLIVPVYFEKSKWVVATILAVLKAGHAFTLIDPKDPPARTSQIVQQTSAKIALTSTLHRSTVEAIIGRCIVVDDDLVASLPSTCDHDQPKPVVTPQDLAYVIFTSGSTGNPKGIMIEHRAFASCAAQFGPALGIHKGTRALQFAAHGFGACLLETLTPLLLGGCVCIPSEHDRMHNIPAFIRRSHINWAMATPSYATTFAPDDVPGLHTLVLVGEQMSAAVNRVWAARLQLLDGYGQSESSSVCFVGRIGRPQSADPNNMGRAVGAHAWIVEPGDPDRLAPIGATGELLIESPGVARGYIAAPPTDEVPFLETPPAWYAPRERTRGVGFYRTGDLARYAADGTVVCLGRVDSQVKIRGQRVEMGAVETRLREYVPSDVTVVAEAVARGGSSGSKVITAFLISASKTENGGLTSPEAARILDEDATQDMNEKLRQVLPPHSVPSCYICLDALPRTATGKVDRRRLRAIGSNLLSQQVQGASSLSQPIQTSMATGAEANLERVWRQIFNLASGRLNAEASFFELGGDSITAIKMVNLARASAIELRVSDIFQYPTLARLQAAVSGGSTPLATIPTSSWDGPVEQSYSQGRLWFLDQLDIGSLWYLIPYAVRMRGRLDVDALSRALLALEQRHETLRTTFDNKDGVCIQVVHEKLAGDLRIINVADTEGGYAQALEKEQTTAFDLTSEAGWRASLIKLSQDDHVLSIVMHHIISDGWSIDVLRRELGQLYAAALHNRDLISAVSPLPIQYRDFSQWQKQETQAASHEQQLHYWQAQLADSSPAKLPTDFPRPALLSGAAGVVPITITGALFHHLQTFCQHRHTTPFAVLLAAFRAAHYRLTGADDAVIGTPIANRNRHELEGLIGFFVNTQCMRIVVDDEDSFGSLVRRVRDTTTAAFAHEDVPFERVVAAMLPGSRDLSQNPLAQLIFALHSQKDLGRFELEGLESEAVASKPYTRFDAEFHLFQAPNGLTGYVHFAAELFRPESMRNLVSVFLQILRRGLESPETCVSVLPLTDGLEELRDMGLLEVDRVEYERESSMVDIFRAQAATCPDAIAVIDSSSRLTYAELDQQSDLLETWLRRQGLPAEALVGVLSPRSCETIVAFLGILKANLAYLPLDTRSPVARMKDILSTLPKHTIVMLGSEVTTPDFQLPGLELLHISDALQPCTVNGVSDHKPAPASAPSATSLAYVLYTSGSTGRPKGVMVEHRSIVRLVKRNVIPNFPPAQGAVMAHLFNTVFDGASYEIFLMLLNGGTLVCVDYMTTLSPKALADVFAKEQVNSAIMTPALLKLYLADGRDALKGLDMLMVAGDRFDPQDAIDAQTLVRGQCYNAYGPTENGVMSTLYAVDTNDSFINGVPLGRAISNSGAYITDINQQLVGPGVMGELVVTGDGLARGYTDPALNKNRFIQLTVDNQTVKAYRTGDRMRYRVGHGMLEFFGRMDFQFKIRSNRIESAEVEAAMLSHPLVRDAAVVLRVQEEQQQPEMVGFVVAENDDVVVAQETDSHVERWQDLIESNLYADIDRLSPAAVGKDFTGWTSMYDGSQIDEAEMQEWLDDTIETLRDGQPLGHVLEIGTGTGMMLFNLGAGLKSYVGLEPTKSAAAFVNKAIQSLPDLASKATVHLGTATDVSTLRGLHPDTVVLNSVVQYFPSAEYLADVVDLLVQIPGVKRLFFGDVRSQATNTHFLTARAVRALGPGATKEAVRTHMAGQQAREEELLVEPAFFTALVGRLPERVRHVEVLPKRMQATNELSAYRYAAVVYLRGAEERPVYPIAADDWVDFQASQMRRDALREYLRLADNAVTVAVSNIPYSKTMADRLVAESLEDSPSDAQPSTLDGPAWIASVRADAESRACLSVTDLAQLAAESGFQVAVSAARQWSQSGALDAVFYRSPASTPSVRTLFQFPTDNEVRQSAVLANQPLQRFQKQRIAVQVRERLQALVPSYMIPAHIVALDQMPLNANGKVDRKELARQARLVQKPAPQKTAAPMPVAPIGDIERILCEEAAVTFGMKIDIGDHFFKMGGHSLLATRLISRIGNRLQARITVKDMFDHPVFSELAVVIRQELAVRNAIPTAADGGQVRQGSAGVAPRTEMETMLCEEFATVLGMDVGITDNFFDLGGHSLMATKLAARIGHRLDTTISVKAVFNQPVLFQLASTLELAQLKSSNASHDTKMADYAPFQLLSVEDAQDFVQNEISPRLGFAHGNIQDVYPVTHMQRTFLCEASTGCPKPLVPFYIDFPAGSDAAALVCACASLVARFDMFRTVFVDVAGQFYQVVLEHLALPSDIVETEENVHTATSDFVDRVGAEPVHLGQPMMRTTILKQASSVRVLLWLSHALYDGLSLQHVVRDLHLLYKGKSLLPVDQFSRYMQYVAHTRQEASDFWRDVLQDAPLTVLSSGERALDVGAARTLHATNIISMPAQAVRSSTITQATVFNAACAIVLSQETGSQDVVFGRIVSGRQGLPVSWQNIVGPCTNAVPVRARIDASNHQAMLRDMQDQYLLSLPFETLGFDEVRRRCAEDSWPATATNYACCVTYHDFSYHPESEVDAQRVEMGVLAKKTALQQEEPLYELGIAGEVEPDGAHLQVTVVAKARLFGEERAKQLLEAVCRTFARLNESLGAEGGGAMTS